MPAQATYDNFDRQTLTNNTTGSVTFSNIPQTYTDIVAVVQSYNTSNAFLQYMVIGSSNGNYSGTVLRATGTTSTSSRYTNDNVVLADSPVGQNYQNSAFGTYIYHIFNYSNTNVFKTVISRFAGETGSAGNTMLSIHTKRSTDAVTSIVFSVGGGNFASGTTFSLYGIKAA